MPNTQNIADFVQQIHADMHWLIHSPGLINIQADFVDDTFLSSPQIDIDTALNNYDLISTIFSPGKPLVGHYFEQLILFWLKANPDYSPIQQHIRLCAHNKTLGELDFVFESQSTQTSFHWEVAVKYFLLHDQMFIGPNPADTLEKKYNKLRLQQLPLSKSSLANQMLAERGFHLPLISQALLKGWLFYPLNSDWKNPPVLLDIISPKHNRGWWTSIKQLDLSMHSTESRWLILEKPYWFALANLHKKPMHNRDEIEAYLHRHFHHTHHAVLLAELVQNNNQWQEKSRGFVVHANWPQTDLM